MVIKRFYNEKLAQASYLIGCPAAGEAMIIDANRDVEQYVEAAAREGMRVIAVTETHIHADYLSGSRELAVVTGAQLYLSGEGDNDWKYEFSSDARAKLIKHGDKIQIGAVRFDVMKTPGHTPEHICFVVTDEASSKEPMGIFSGDFIFVGDVGRPDLLETAAGIKGSMETGARQLFSSIQAAAGLPAHVLVWPGHGAGSACGKALGAVPVSSLGYERLTNWALRAQSEESFVREVLSGQPEPPAYFAQMKRMNKVGPPLLNGIRTPPRRLDGRDIRRFIDAGVVVIDIREAEAYIAKHIPGTLSLPGMYRSFITWAGSVVPYDADILLIGSDESSIEQPTKELSLIGLDRVVGWYGEDILEDFERPAEQLESMDEVDPAQLLSIPANTVVIDVRNKTEWDEGHVPGSMNISLSTLVKRIGELPRDKQLWVHCQTSGRSPVAVSLLRSMGFDKVANIREGYEGYAKLSPKKAVIAG
jgi:hydroxyacylglutathione hydrolase